MTDKIIKKTHNLVLFSFERLHHKMTTWINFIRVSSRKIWNKKWKEKMKKVQYRELISKINYCHLNIYIKRPKTHNAFISQLKINKIEFNKFLHERYVFDVLIAYCLCDEKHIIIKHMLLFCSNWRKKRKKMLQKTKITNIRQLFNERKTITIVVRTILIIDLLNQFQATKLLKEKKISRS